MRFVTPASNGDPVRCVTLKPDIKAPTWIASLGLTIKPSQVIDIREDLAKSLQRQYPWLKEVERFERDVLQGGAYQIRAAYPADRVPEPEEAPASSAPEPEPAKPLASGDRSMAGVGKGKVKRK